MDKRVGILIVSAKGDLLMRRSQGSKVSAFVGELAPGEVPVRAAARVLAEETGLDVHADDLEFLDSYYETPDKGREIEAQIFIVAGVDEDRVHAYGSEESLQKIHRSDDFEAVGLSVSARKYVIDYFRSHKKW